MSVPAPQIAPRGDRPVAGRFHPAVRLQWLAKKAMKAHPKADRLPATIRVAAGSPSCPVDIWFHPRPSRPTLPSSATADVAPAHFQRLSRNLRSATPADHHQRAHDQARLRHEPSPASPLQPARGFRSRPVARQAVGVRTRRPVPDGRTQSSSFRRIMELMRLGIVAPPIAGGHDINGPVNLPNSRRVRCNRDDHTLGPIADFVRPSGSRLTEES